MRTIQTIAEVKVDGTIQISLPKDISPGQYRIVLVLEEEPIEELTEEEKVYLDEELKKIEENPNYGVSGEEVLKKIEVKLGKKLQIHSKS